MGDRFRWLALVSVSVGLSIAAEPTSVILISIDTLRADHLSSYGYHRIRTPNIDSFAQQGTLFSNIESQVPLTLPSHTSLLTSTYPFENQIEENAERVPPGRVTLASVLRSHGYKTAAFIGSVFLESEMGLDQGFDLYDSPFHFEAFSPISGLHVLRRRGPQPVRRQRPARRCAGAGRGAPLAGGQRAPAGRPSVRVCASVRSAQAIHSRRIRCRTGLHRPDCWARSSRR